MNTKLSRLFFIWIIILLFLSACTPPPPVPYIRVEKVEVENNVVYIRASQHCSGYGDCGIGKEYVYYASKDYGKTWRAISSPSKEIIQTIDQDQTTPYSICLNTSQVCYLITGKENIEISKDGGGTWQIDWQFPYWRKTYMERTRQKLYHVDVDGVPLDMKVVGTAAGDIVIVAMGNQGVLVKEPGGNWNPKSVGSAYPVPYHSFSLGEASRSTPQEFLIALLLALALCITLSFQGILTVHIKTGNVFHPKFLWIFFPFILAIVFFFIFTRSVSLGSNEILEVVVDRLSSYEVFPLSMCFIPLIGLALTWIVFVVILPRRGNSSIAAALSPIIQAVILFVVIWTPFMLWALGNIPMYEIAEGLAVVLGMVFIFFGFRAEHRIAILVSKSQIVA